VARESEQIYGNVPFERAQGMDAALAGFRLIKSNALRIEAIGPLSLLGEREIYASLWKQGKPVDF